MWSWRGWTYVIHGIPVELPVDVQPRLPLIHIVEVVPKCPDGAANLCAPLLLPIVTRLLAMVKAQEVLQDPQVKVGHRHPQRSARVTAPDLVLARDPRQSVPLPAGRTGLDQARCHLPDCRRTHAHPST